MDLKNVWLHTNESLIGQYINLSCKLIRALIIERLVSASN